MSLGIEKSLATVADVQRVLVDGVGLVKAGMRGVLGLPAILSGVLKLGGDVKDLAMHAPGALPELKDVDGVEAGKLAEASYSLVRAVVAALAA